jgi:hypothetical protein
MGKPRDPGAPTQPTFDPAPLLGRPTDYRPEFCDRVVEEMGNGFSLGGFAGVIGVTRRTLSEWMSVHPEFSLAVSAGKAARLAQWERAGMKAAFTQEGGNSTIIIFGLKNAGRAGPGEEEEWADKTDVNLKGAIGTYDASKLAGLSDEELAAFSAILARIATGVAPSGGGEGGDSEA